MKRSRFTESQIVRILKEVEGGRMVKDVCREYGMSDATYYNWKAKYGGMWHGSIRCQTAERVGEGKPASQADVC